MSFGERFRDLVPAVNGRISGPCITSCIQRRPFKSIDDYYVETVPTAVRAHPLKLADV